MDISFNNFHECNLMENIINGYEKSRESEKRSDSVDVHFFINQMKSAIDSYRIDQVFDFIGSLHCRECRHSWTAIVGKTANNMPCPKCDNVVEIPSYKFVKGSR